MPDLSELFQRAAADLGPARQPGFETLVAARRRRDRVRTAGAVLGLAVLVGAGALALPGTGRDRATAPADRSPVRTGYSCLLPSGGTVGVGQERTVQGRVVRCDSVAWTSAAPPLPDSTVLAVTVPSQGCDQDLSPAVRESSDHVEVAVLALRTASPGRQCAIRPPATRFAQLRALLGGRPVVHAPLGGTGGSSTPDGPAYTVTGVLQVLGGPPHGGVAHPVHGLVLLDDGHGLAGSVSVGADGRFAVPVPPGTYQLVGESPGLDGALGHQAVTVTDHDVTGVTLQTIVP